MVLSESLTQVMQTRPILGYGASIWAGIGDHHPVPAFWPVSHS